MAKATKATKAKKKPADFKRPKRKVGRKAPQAANVTSVAVSSRRINMLEQSVLQDKGDAVTHRHLTLQDLLQQIGHYNAHVRQRALQGLRELAQTHTSNVLANVSVVLERFLRTFVDEEAIVREAAINAWKVLIPVMLEGKSLKPFAKLITMYFCSGLTHLQIGIRQDTLKAISVVLETVPELISVDAGLEQLGRLIENFRDLIAATSSQGIKVTNSYDLLNMTSSKSKKQTEDATGASSGSAGSGKKKNKANASALALRFAALNVLHKLLQSIGFSDRESDETKKTSHKIVRNSQRMASLASTRVLLLYKTPTLVVGNQSERLRSIGFWQVKSRTLLKPLYDLWLECLESDTIETLTEEYVESMQRIVESATVILAVNVASLSSQEADAELLHATKKIQEQFMMRFPMFPSNNLAANGEAYLSRWYGINVAIAKFACVVLRWPQKTRPASMQGLEGRIASFVTATLSKYTASDELRALSGTHVIVRALLDVLTRVLASTSTPEEREVLLAIFTAFYVKCSPRSMTFRICTAFVIDRLADLRRWPSWPLILQWLTCFGEFLGHLDTSHMELGRQCLFTMISVVKQLPAELASGEAVESVLRNLEQFFNLNDTQDASTTFRFDQLSSTDQLEFVSLVYHLPSYPVTLLRALASCCKSASVHLDAKSFLMDILHQRSVNLDLAHFVSFLMSGILARQTASTTTQQQQQHLELVHHVCRILLSMNLGASLAKILTPALSRQAASLESMDVLDVHTLVLLYRACLASVKPIHRGDLPAELLEDAYQVCWASLLTYGSHLDGQKQHRGLLGDVVALVTLSDALLHRIVEGLAAPVSTQDVSTATKKLRGFQFLVRTASLSAWFIENYSAVANLTAELEKSVPVTAGDEVQSLVRQIRGDVELVAVGQH
ncbi:hypothetical protein Poli38472_002588 [Pythium oligandrum]|uniref:Pre-rRNA-processing protein Ipi1 N-terminal domain-containing protein n=1 Tax=Pythium oligandrum TaxID=41045 RepID=A0A8K1FLA6_PYTOL|nr:hypothetical protein Poli38472_002588 [Pythium oligandrum]|eukprot:TMW63647.1 hypothetical protein Poli38472_002588 [Pythium oligandrum]